LNLCKSPSHLFIGIVPINYIQIENTVDLKYVNEMLNICEALTDILKFTLDVKL